MPIYEFECGNCNKVIEKIQGFNMYPPKCPQCGLDMTKMVSSHAHMPDKWAVIREPVGKSKL